MLSYLHDKLKEIAPVDGVYIDPETSEYTVSYSSDPTVEQLEEVGRILTSWKLEEAKLNKTKNIETNWNTTLNNGWSLGLTTQDVTLLTGTFMLAKESNQQTVFVVDKDGVSHDLSFEDFSNLIVQYGEARSNLSKDYSEKLKYIKYAITVEELELI